ncbi:hypothetical protein ACIB24_16135 [Spongisporangium articulatum]|uniref:Uncharacterized protein n=1 Tax=Spongisporangium articulatum TaxID=3362603 RepID=A0ABW8AQE1_9ACTN
MNVAGPAFRDLDRWTLRLCMIDGAVLRLRMIDGAVLRLRMIDGEWGRGTGR